MANARAEKISEMIAEAKSLVPEPDQALADDAGVPLSTLIESWASGTVQGKYSFERACFVLSAARRRVQSK